MDEREIRDLDDDLSREPLPAAVRDIPWGLMFLGLWLVLLIVFTVQNADDATVRFLWMEATMPVAILVITSAVASSLLTGFAQAVYRRKKRKAREAKSKAEG
jgi:uncharacterized integral membrane protein